MIRITLPDGSLKEFDGPVTPLSVAASISPNLARMALGARSNGTFYDLRTPLTEDLALTIVTSRDPEGLEVLRHSAAHLLANAVQNLFPNAKLGFGPATADGFFYDFQVERPFTEEDLAKIEAEMRRLAKEDLPIEREELTFQDAITRLEAQGEQLKAEHLRSLLEKAQASGGAVAFDAEDDAELAAAPRLAGGELGSEANAVDAPPKPAADLTITIYKQDRFWDLCRGPHVQSTGELKHVRLLATSGAYWKGSEKNPMLQRIYGTVFFKKQDLDDYLTMLEEAKKRDHRKLGQEMELFMFPEIVGSGMPLYKPKGALLRQVLMDWWLQNHLARGYEIVATPHLFKSTLWQTSGHLENYGENMYVFEHHDGAQYGLKPMNCPGHIVIFRDEQHSYRSLPRRFFEFGTVYRYERSGVLHGLMRVRALTQDDSHIFCTPDQLVDELVGVIDFVDFLYTTMDFPYTAKLATKPAKSVGSDEIWDLATGKLIEALEARGMDYGLDPGGGAFYGPKIDFFMRDAIGRTWQGATIQCDFNLPQRFGLQYIGSDNSKHQPIMVHRAILGTIERFLGVYIEHVAGNFPAWLAPEQVRVMNITDAQADYAQAVAAELFAAGIRAHADIRNEKIGFKIREGEIQKVPYLLIVGGKEKESGQVAVRRRHEGDLGAIPIAEFLARHGAEFAPPKIAAPVPR